MQFNHIDAASSSLKKRHTVKHTIIQKYSTENDNDPK